MLILRPNLSWLRLIGRKIRRNYTIGSEEMIRFELDNNRGRFMKNNVTVMYNFKVPGAWSLINGEKISFFGSTLWKESKIPSDARAIEVAEV